MINHGSGMLLCLKTVSNKLTTLAPRSVKRCIVMNEHGLARHSQKSTPLREFYSSSFTSSSSPVMCPHQATCDQFSTGHLKAHSVNVRFSKPSSRAILHCNSERRIFPRKPTLLCSQVETQLGIPCSGTQDDIVLVNSSSKDILSDYKTENATLLFSDLERQMILLSRIDEGFGVKKEFLTGNPNDPPTEEQLEKVRSTLMFDLPQFFVKPLNYTIYHPSIEFENNIQGKRTKGIYDYVKQAAYFRTVGHIRFIYIKYEVMKITAHPEDGTVRVRWKINTIKFRRLLKFWQLKLWDWSTIWNKIDVWYDGFSTYYVRGDGLVYKHVADRMMPDQEPLLEKKIVKAGTPTETLICEKTSPPFSILYNPSKNSSQSLDLSGYQ